MLRKTMLTLSAMFVLAGATPTFASDGTAGRFDGRARAQATEAITMKTVMADEGSGSDACACCAAPRYTPRVYLRH